MLNLPFILCMYMCFSVSVYLPLDLQMLWRLEEGVGSFGAGVTGTFQLF